MNKIEINFDEIPIKANPFDHIDNVEILEKCLIWLTKKQKDIICRRYGIGIRQHSIEEIGKRYKIARQRVYSIIHESIEKMREKLLQTGYDGGYDDR